MASAIQNNQIDRQEEIGLLRLQQAKLTGFVRQLPTNPVGRDRWKLDRAVTRFFSNQVAIGIDDYEYTPWFIGDFLAAVKTEVRP